MTKPILNSFSPMFPIRSQEYERYLPNAFDQSLTLLEKVNQVILQLDRMGRLSNDIVEQWQQVMDWVLNDGLYENVVGVIDKMTETGVFQDILESEMLSVVNNSTAYYLEASTEKYFDDISNTTYYITRIPYKDDQGKIIKIKRGFANDSINGGTGETARSFAKRHKATLTVNASIFDTSTLKFQGVQIVDGKIINTGIIGSRYVLAFDDDNNFKVYPPEVDPQKILNEGYKNALTSFIPLIENFEQVDQSIIDGYTASDDPHPRNVIAQFENKDILIFTCDGRTTIDTGMTIPDVIRILQRYGVKFAFNLDGGGSAQTIYRDTLVNKAIDNNGYDERKVPDFLYFGKDLIAKRDIDIVENAAQIGEALKEIANLRIDIRNKTQMLNGYIDLVGSDSFKTFGITTYNGETKKNKLMLQSDQMTYWDYINGNAMFTVFDNGDIKSRKGTLGSFFKANKQISDLNTISESGFYWAVSGTSNAPTSSHSYAIIHCEDDNGGKSAIQFAICFSGGAGAPSQFNVRVKDNFSWNDWRM